VNSTQIRSLHPNLFPGPRRRSTTQSEQDLSSSHFR